MSSWCDEVANFTRVVKKAHQEWFIEKLILSKDDCRHLKHIYERLELQRQKDEKIAKVIAAIKPFLGGMPVKHLEEMAIALLGVAKQFEKDNDSSIYPVWFRSSFFAKG